MSPANDRTIQPFPVSNLTANGRERDERQKHDRVNETQLIARVIAGDRLAGRTLYDTHAPRVYSLAYRLSGDAEKAREFTQDTFIRAFSRLSQFRGDAAFSTWLHRIVVTVVRTRGVANYGCHVKWSWTKRVLSRKALPKQSRT